MLHILWVLIKFILIMLGILLGLVLLAILLLLFDPVRYRVQAKKEAEGLEAVKADARVSWLFGLISLRAFYTDGKPGVSVRIFGIPFEKLKRLLGRKKGAASSSPPARRAKKRKCDADIPPEKSAKEVRQPDADEVLSESDSVRREGNPQGKKMPETADFAKSRYTENENPEKDKSADAAENEARQKDKSADSAENETRQKDKSADSAENEARQKGGPADFARNENPEEERPAAAAENAAFERNGLTPFVEEENPQEVPSGLFSRILGILKTILGLPVRAVKFLFALPGKIAAAIQKIRVTIQGICDKISWWREFLEDEHTRAVLLLGKEQAGGLLRHILPTRVSGRVTFGCEDPSLTGRILAVLGMSFPFHKNCIAVTPLFDGENHLTGHIFLKGRIYGIVILAAVLKIYFNQNTKYVISQWKSKA